MTKEEENTVRALRATADFLELSPRNRRIILAIMREMIASYKYTKGDK